jgi:hypothetical protein
MSLEKKIGFEELYIIFVKENSLFKSISESLEPGVDFLDLEQIPCIKNLIVQLFRNKDDFVAEEVAAGCFHQDEAEEVTITLKEKTPKGIFLLLLFKTKVTFWGR